METPVLDNQGNRVVDLSQSDIVPRGPHTLEEMHRLHLNVSKNLESITVEHQHVWVRMEEMLAIKA